MEDLKVPKAPIERIIRSVDGEMRVSSDAVDLCVKKTIELLRTITKKAVNVVKHEKRKTIQKRDIEFAFKEFL